MPDMTLREFAAFLSGLAHGMPAAEKRGLDKGAQLIEYEARREIGAYQTSAGPFSAWPLLAPSTMADRVSKGFPADEPLLRTGALRNSIGRRVGTREAVIGSDLPIAVWQEFGTRRIPARSFIGGATVRKAEEAVQAIAQEVFGPLMRGRR